MIQDYVMCMFIGVCGTCMIFSFITNSISKRRKFALASMAFLAMMLLIANKVANIYNGSEVVIEYRLARMCKFMVYALYLIIVFMFNVYLKDLFFNQEQTQYVSRRLKTVDYIVISGEIMLVISQFTNFYYSYVNNFYQRSKWFVISYIFPLTSLVIQLSVILRNSGKFRKRLLFPLVMFTIAPIWASIFQFFLHGVSLVTSTIVSMVVLLYAFSILDTNRLIMKAHKKEIENLLEKQNNIRTMVAQTTSALVEAIDAKDNYTKGHSKRVAQYAMQIAERVGKTPEECEEIFLIALLHDVGKIGIPNAIINKKTKLTDGEAEVIKTHTLIGREILEKISISPSLSIGAFYHHERFDGKGYPMGIKEEEIPEIARIIAVADTYDAMASKRSYRDVLPQKVVREEIEKGISTQFDPVFAKAMLELIDEDTEYHMRQQN